MHNLLMKLQLRPSFLRDWTRWSHVTETQVWIDQTPVERTTSIHIKHSVHVWKKWLHSPHHTHRSCAVAGCVTWILLSELLVIPVGNGSFCVCPMGRWFVVDWSRTSQSRPFVCLPQRIGPCDHWFKACVKLMAVCPHRGNSRHISKEALEAPSQVSAHDIVWLQKSTRVAPRLTVECTAHSKYNTKFLHV